MQRRAVEDSLAVGGGSGADGVDDRDGSALRVEDLGRQGAERGLGRDPLAVAVVRVRRAVAEGIDDRLAVAVGVVDKTGPPTQSVDLGLEAIVGIVNVGGPVAESVDHRERLIRAVAHRVVREREPVPQRIERAGQPVGDPRHGIAITERVDRRRQVPRDVEAVFGHLALGRW